MAAPLIIHAHNDCYAQIQATKMLMGVKAGQLYPLKAESRCLKTKQVLLKC